jgi:hypothetical protein
MFGVLPLLAASIIDDQNRIDSFTALLRSFCHRLYAQTSAKARAGRLIGIPNPDHPRTLQSPPGPHESAL